MTDGIDRARVSSHGELFSELVALFLEDAPRHERALSAALEAGDDRSAVRVAHTLRGAAANIGARALADAAGSVEVALRNGELTEARSRMRDVRASLGAACDALRRLVVDH